MAPAAGRVLGLRDGAAALRQHAQERLHHHQEPALPHRQRPLYRRPADHPRPPGAAGALARPPRGDRAAAEDRPGLHLRAPSAQAVVFLLQREDPLHLDLFVRQGPQVRRARPTAPSSLWRAPSLELHRANFKRFLRFCQECQDKTNGFRRDPHWSPQSMVLNGTTAGGGSTSSAGSSSSTGTWTPCWRWPGSSATSRPRG